MLFVREMKKIVCSFSWVLFVAAIGIAMYTQGVFGFAQDLLHKPAPGENYGVKQEEIPEQIMPEALSKLWEEFCANEYKTYPIGFIKTVKLSEKEQKKMAGILAEITGMDAGALLREGNRQAPADSDGFTMEMNGDLVQNSEGEFAVAPENAGSLHVDPDEADGAGFWQPSVQKGMAYEEFRELMDRADALLGGGSAYEAASLIQYGTVSLTYEEAEERYDLAVNSDRITGGYARLFADYATVMVMSLLPVFPAVILCMKDRQARMEELIHTNRVTAARLVMSRYLALVAACILPVLILSYVSNIPLWGVYGGMNLDYLAPARYTFGWILPSVMAAAAVGMFVTELTGTPLAVAVQGLWWLLDVNAGYRSLSSSYSLFRLAPRHNAGPRSWFRTQEYLEHRDGLLCNRLLFVAGSFALVALTIWIYEQKRRGRIKDGISLVRACSGLGNRKGQSEA